jgi:hypothetical protein
MLVVALGFVFSVGDVLIFVHGLFRFGVFDPAISMSIRPSLCVFNARGCGPSTAMSLCQSGYTPPSYRHRKC